MCETLILELGDSSIFAVGGIVSGHTLKHLTAAAGVACLIEMLRVRTRSFAPSTFALHATADKAELRCAKSTSVPNSPGHFTEAPNSNLRASEASEPRDRSERRSGERERV
jgi:hypothetical protein